jgi:hypothetical protein
LNRRENTVDRNSKIRVSNVEIIFSGEPSCFNRAGASVQEGFRNNYGTFSFPVAISRPISKAEHSSLISLFGSWRESGKEDQDLKEIYQSRLAPSTCPEE